jgi:Fe-S-cluster containining protein
MRLIFCKSLEFYLTYCNYLQIIERCPISPKGGFFTHSFKNQLTKKVLFSSKNFLDTYTLSDFDEEICLPMILLKMKDDDYRRCPFVSSEGCLIYHDRLGACRIYPLGRAAKTGFSQDEIKEHYFMVKEPHCLGFKEERIWSVREWLKDKEVDSYNENNKY